MTLQLQTADGGFRWHQKAVEFATVKWWPGRSMTDTRRNNDGNKSVRTDATRRELHTSEFKGAHRKNGGMVSPRIIHARITM